MSSQELGENKAPQTVSVAVEPLCPALVAIFWALMQYPEVGVEGKLTTPGGAGGSRVHCIAPS